MRLLRAIRQDGRPLAERWQDWAARQDGALLALAASPQIVRPETRRRLGRMRTLQALALAARAAELGLDPGRWVAAWEAGGSPEPPPGHPQWVTLRADMDAWELECLG